MESGKEEPTFVMENVTRVTVQDDRVRLTSLLGASEEMQARIVDMDFMDGRLLLSRPD
jgi:predicted RNA-binding protein